MVTFDFRCCNNERSSWCATTNTKQTADDDEGILCLILNLSLSIKTNDVILSASHFFQRNTQKTVDEVKEDTDINES